MKKPFLATALYLYVVIALMLSNIFLIELSAYFIIGYIFGNWAGQEGTKKDTRRRNG